MKLLSHILLYPLKMIISFLNPDMDIIYKRKTKTMKLYTEEQVRIAIQQARHYSDYFNMEYEFSTDDIIKELTIISFPNDEEIDRELHKHIIHGGGSSGWIMEAFVKGAKWMRDKIKGGSI